MKPHVYCIIIDFQIAPYRKEPLTIVRAHVQNNQMALESQMHQQLSHGSGYAGTSKFVFRSPCSY